MKIITRYAKMWPRVVFDYRDKNKLLQPIRDLLNVPGVYVLYRDDQPYYVGKAKRLHKRIWAHANAPKDKHYNFWNYFSAFIVPQPKYLDEIEGILIASMPTDNSTVHRIKRLDLPVGITKFIKKQRIVQYAE